MNVAELAGKSKEELIVMVHDLGLTNGFVPEKLRKDDLLHRILEGYAEQEGYLLASGILDIMNDGYGFLRQTGRRVGQNDVYVSQSQVRRFGLRTGDMVLGQVRSPKESERYHGLLRVESVNGVDPEAARRRPNFENLTPIFPDQQLTLEAEKGNLSGRVIDLVAPIGRGQRGLIVAPPKAGKTTLLKEIANGITQNYTDIYLMVALIGERPQRCVCRVASGYVVKLHCYRGSLGQTRINFNTTISVIVKVATRCNVTG